jgi:translation elongation factor EF-Tu-like GTPase
LALNLCDSVEVFVEQVLADEGRAKAIAFDEIDKAPEEKKRGITIATVKHSSFYVSFKVHTQIMHLVKCYIVLRFCKHTLEL